MASERDTEGTWAPTCPHCGVVDQDWWDGTALKDDGDTEVVDCGSCGKPYETTLHVSTDFDTRPVAGTVEGET